MTVHNSSTPIRYGAFLTTAHFLEFSETEVFDNTLAYAEAAEELGFEDIWLLEHHFTRYGLCTDSTFMASFLLGRMKEIKVGTAIVPLPLQHPIRLAERVAMLDQMSHGRFLFGVGRGDFIRDFEVIGQDIAQSSDCAHAAWDIIEKAWSGEGVANDAPFWKPFPKVVTVPKPYSSPRPPAYAAASSPSSVEWAARHGIPLMLLFYLEDEMKKANIDLWGEIAAEHGHDPSPDQHLVSTVINVGDTTEEAREAIADRFVWWALEADKQDELAQDPDRKKEAYSFHYGIQDEEVLRGQMSLEEAYLEKLFRLCPIGDVDRCVDRICDQVEMLGIRHFVAGFEGVGTRDRTIASMGRFMEEVAPRVEERLSRGDHVLGAAVGS